MSTFVTNEAREIAANIALEDLKTDLARLRTDVYRLLGVTAELTRQRTKTAIGVVESALDEATRIGSSIHKHLNGADAEIREYVVQNPLLAALTFTAFGYVVGRLKR
jgi:ElaB/YqjD/DUF883 family membrane-anchored ribosome-binding protein